MYKTYYAPDKAYNYFPHMRSLETLRVISIGESHPWPTYKTAVMNRQCYVWHFLKCGKILYRGQIAEGPCSFLMIPGKNQFYEVAEDSPTGDQRWIIFTGSALGEFLKKSGLSTENAIFPCPQIDRVWEIFDELVDLDTYNDKADDMMLLCALFRLLALHSKCVSSKQTNKKDFSPYAKKLLEYIRKNYAKPLTEASLASHVNLSVNYMHRCFCKEVGMPPIHYLTTIRLQHAKVLLTDSDYSISHIAESVGFSNGNYFCRVFQKYNNRLSPTQYRKKKKAEKNKK